MCDGTNRPLPRSAFTTSLPHTADGTDAVTTLCLGGSGAIAAAAHVRPDLFVAMCRAVVGGRLDEGRRIFDKLAPMIQALCSEPNPAPVKAALGRKDCSATSCAHRRRERAILTGIQKAMACTSEPRICGRGHPRFTYHRVRFSRN